MSGADAQRSALAELDALARAAADAARAVTAAESAERRARHNVERAAAPLDEYLTAVAAAEREPDPELEASLLGELRAAQEHALPRVDPWTDRDTGRVFHDTVWVDVRAEAAVKGARLAAERAEAERDAFATEHLADLLAELAPQAWAAADAGAEAMAALDGAWSARAAVARRVHELCRWARRPELSASMPGGSPLYELIGLLREADTYGRADRTALVPLPAVLVDTAPCRSRARCAPRWPRTCWPARGPTGSCSAGPRSARSTRRRCASAPRRRGGAPGWRAWACTTAATATPR